MGSWLLVIMALHGDDVGREPLPKVILVTEQQCKAVVLFMTPLSKMAAFCVAPDGRRVHQRQLMAPPTSSQSQR
jgi:hypothetical protein